MTTPATPKFQAITDDIVAQILAGKLRSGDKIPSTSELQAQYGASYGTVRTALLVLATMGLIEGRWGKGRYITTPGAWVTPGEWKP